MLKHAKTTRQKAVICTPLWSQLVPPCTPQLLKLGGNVPPTSYGGAAPGRGNFAFSKREFPVVLILSRPKLCRQVAQLSQRDRAARWVSYRQKWKTGTGRQYLWTLYRFIFNHCDIFGQQRNRNRRKTQNKGYYAVQGHPRSSKVIEVGTNRKPVCDFLLVINSN